MPDLCVSYSPGNIKALKFSEYVEDIPSDAKEIIKTLFGIFTKSRYYCPEIAKMKYNKGIRLRWKDDDNYINASLYYNNLDIIYYTFGNSHSFEEAMSDISETGIEEFLQKRELKCPNLAPVPYAPMTPKKRRGI